MNTIIKIWVFTRDAIADPDKQKAIQTPLNLIIVVLLNHLSKGMEEVLPIIEATPSSTVPILAFIFVLFPSSPKHNL